jgi:hypothetical protein
MVTDEELAEVERLDREATPGPWERDSKGAFRTRNEDQFNQRIIHASSYPGEEGKTFASDADASLIARFRTLAPRLAAEVRHLRAVSSGWKLLARALIIYHGRGSQSDVLQAIANLERLGVKVP